ncbi:ribosomal RNA small subunit methyltransferase nep-1 [Senna tora]|uniref:Ribosomal RNA small subunit methyltransferase nep-1 n=1 Tax=Senna tora TaxID=362788 RepID=A0A834X0Z5_9FABA|nr:ribosomal RNA small subunit methyltransferase nep-1 [Senna tora]
MQNQEMQRVSGQKRKRADARDHGIPLPAEESKIIFILERASLEVGKYVKTDQLLSWELHSDLLRKTNRSPQDCRPDLLHKALLMILDSPLNQVGRVEAIFIRTQQNILIRVAANIVLPRTFVDFSHLMLKLFKNHQVRQSGQIVLEEIRNPLADHLPLDSYKIGLAEVGRSMKVVKMNEYTAAMPRNKNLVFVVDALGEGKIEADYVYTNDIISVSGCHLDAAFCLGKICTALLKMKI